MPKAISPLLERRSVLWREGTVESTHNRDSMIIIAVAAMTLQLANHSTHVRMSNKRHTHGRAAYKIAFRQPF
jgi:hypothetical protein